MVNLVPALCPCCGGQLELDDNMKRAECKYCKNIIIVDEAIEKYNLDRNGNIKVSGIKDLDMLLEEAQKYYKIENYIKAIATCNTLLSIDAFNEDAIIIKLESFIEIANQISFFEEKLKKGDREVWDISQGINNTYDELNQIAIANNSKDKIYSKIRLEEVEKCNQIKELLEKEIKRRQKEHERNIKIEKINYILNEFSEFVKSETMGEKLTKREQEILLATCREVIDEKISFASTLYMHFDEIDGQYILTTFDEQGINEVKIILNNKYSDMNEIYEALQAAYDQMMKRYHYATKICMKLNNFIDEENDRKQKKKIKYICKKLKIHEKYIVRLKFEDIDDINVYYKTDYMDSYRKSSKHGMKLEEIENMMEQY